MSEMNYENLGNEVKVSAEPSICLVEVEPRYDLVAKKFVWVDKKSGQILDIQEEKTEDKPSKMEVILPAAASIISAVCGVASSVVASNAKNKTMEIVLNSNLSSYDKTQMLNRINPKSFLDRIFG